MAPTPKKRVSNDPVPVVPAEFRCPYTGNLMKVEQIGDLSRGVAYRAVGGFDPTQWHNNSEDLLRFMTLRKGEPTKLTPRCAYTGAVGTVIFHPRIKKYQISGVFGPSKLYTDRARLEYDLSFRDGVATRPEPKDVKISVREITPPPSNPVVDLVDGGRSTSDIAAEVLDRLA